MTPLTDPDGREHGHQDQDDGGSHDAQGLNDSGFSHDPSGPEEDDHAEDVDQAGGEDPVPGPKQDAL